VDTVPVLAESTAGVELAGKVEKAITAKSKALVPREYSKAGRARSRDAATIGRGWARGAAAGGQVRTRGHCG